MRQHIAAGTDLLPDARFVDAIAHRQSTILDVGCGHGSAVASLRKCGHTAYGVDPTAVVLDIAREQADASWFRQLSAQELTAEGLHDAGLPPRFDLVLMAGNVPAFLPAGAFAQALVDIRSLLTPGGLLVIATSTRSRGGPADQHAAAAAAGLRLSHRFGDWHLGKYHSESPWSVSVFSAPGERPAPEGPDGVFVLPA